MCNRLAGTIADKCIYSISICSDSQAAVKTIRKSKTTFKLVRECISALATSHPVCVTWVPGHTGKHGNERADQLARHASILTFMGPEPSLLISQTVINTAIWDWARQQHNKRWREELKHAGRRRK